MREHDKEEQVREQVREKLRKSMDKLIGDNAKPLEEQRPKPGEQDEVPPAPITKSG